MFKELFSFFRKRDGLISEENPEKPVAADAIESTVSRFVEQFGKEVHDPELFVSVCRGLFATTQYSIKRIKWPSENIPRFSRLMDALEAGLPGFPESNAQRILKALNQYSRNHSPIEEWGGDVAWHFRISSTFSNAGKLLYNAVRIFQPETVLELGTGYGMSAMFLLLALQGRGKLWTVEMCEPQYSLSRKLLTRQFNNVSCAQGAVQESLPAIFKKAGPVEFVFHDAGHSKKSFVEDFESLSLKSDSLVIFDDIYWYDPRFCPTDPQCHQGWMEVVNSDRVRAAVEVDGKAGIVLTR
jgi:predicted O-methyltransferase YrrM